MEKAGAKLELMAPAGSYEALAAAIRAGADSVYFGVDRLNMRARAASPFQIADLRRIARLCHRCGVRAYLALNVVVYDDDLDCVRAVCAAAKDAGIDAVIASDLAAIGAARAAGLGVHVSVQANIANIEAVRFHARQADVVVLARELALGQIAAIGAAIRAENIVGPAGEPVRIELFAHGALCVAIAGTCHMSLAAYNQSANRGECFQSCRRAYRLVDAETGDELEVRNRHVMSPRDLCTIRHLDKLAAAGASVFKIEGRARPAHYVDVVVRAYRKALAAVAAGTFRPEDSGQMETEMAKVFNRGFWDGGYYCGEKLGAWAVSGNSQATRTRVQLGVVSNYYAQAGVAEFSLWQRELLPGCELLVEGPTTGAVQAVAETFRVDGQPAGRAAKGDRVTFAVPAKVRRQDKVYLLVPAP